MQLACVQWVLKLANIEASHTSAEGWARLLQRLIGQGTITLAEAEALARPISLSELVSLSREMRVPRHIRLLSATRAASYGLSTEAPDKH